MRTKVLFVLANSIREKNRCIAGIEIVRDDRGEKQWGTWIRPVSSRNNGAIVSDQCRLYDGAIPQPLDVVQVPLTTKESQGIQPENWFIDDSQNWKKLARWDATIAERLVEKPRDIWLEDQVPCDRVTVGFLSTRKPLQSLYLIRPQACRLCIVDEEYDGKTTQRKRAVFNYNDNTYVLGMTDPFAASKYFGDAEVTDNVSVSIDRCLLCISYAKEEYYGYHYKVVAGVIEL